MFVNLFFIKRFDDDNVRHTISNTAAWLPLAFLLFDSMLNRLKIPFRHVKLNVLISIGFFLMCLFWQLT